MITRDLRCAIARAVAAAGYRQGGDPGLRPTGTPGQYSASIALTLGGHPRETAQALAAYLAEERWIDAVAVTGPGYLTVTVTSAALIAVADSVIAAGPACAASGALAGTAVPAAPPGDPLAAPTWEEARAALAARLAVRLAAAAGATVAALPDTERVLVSPPASNEYGGGESRTRYEDRGTEPDADPQVPAPGAPPGMSGAPRHDIPRNFTTCGEHAPPATGERHETDVARAVAFAGRDAVLFTLARAIPGQPVRVEPEIIARHVLGNPAYAVRYAHARAASGVRWAVASSAADTIGTREVPELLDALSWLPERVAIAARRGRPDEFARYLEELASATVDVLSSAGHPGKDGPPGNTPKSGASHASHDGVSGFDRLPSTSDRESRSGKVGEAQGAGSNPSGVDEVGPSFSGAEEGALSRESPSLSAGRVQRLTLAMAAQAGLAAGLSLLEVGAPERL